MRRSRSLPSTALAATIRMNSRNHLPSTTSRILVTLSFHPMKHLASFQERLLRPSTSRHNTYGGQAIIINIPRATRRQPYHRSLRRVTHNRRVSARRPRNLSTISRSKLKITNHCSFRNLPQRQNITNLNTCFASKTQALSHKYAFNSHSITSNTIVKTNQYQRRTPTRIMLESFNHTTYRVIKIFLGCYRRRIFGSRNSLVR